MGYERMEHRHLIATTSPRGLSDHQYLPASGLQEKVGRKSLAIKDVMQYRNA